MTTPRSEPRRSAVVMPVYNEEATLPSVLDAVRRRFDGEVIIVDDGSSDTTPTILRERDDVRVVTFAENRGYGAALSEGLRVARADGAEVAVSMDCDGQHEPRHIPEFLRAMSKREADILSGSRYLPQSAAAGTAPPQRREVNLAVTTEVNRVTSWGITDAFCGFKAYELSALEGLHLEEPGYAMPMELWAKAWRAGLKVREMPVERIYFDHDRSFGQDLDDPDKRLQYYLRVWHENLAEED